MFFTGGRDGLIGAIKKRSLTSFPTIFGKIYPNKAHGNAKLMTKSCILTLVRSQFLAIKFCSGL